MTTGTATTTDWQVSGQYFETCNCDYVCPCVPSQLTQTTHGECIFAMAFHVDRGHYGPVRLDDLSFVIAGRTPEAMIKGNWEVGLIVDERASADQQNALATIVSGQAGGPMAALAPLIGTFRGVEAKPITFRGEGMRWSVVVPGLLDEAVEGVTGIGGSSEPIYLDNTGHPAADRFALARATHSHLHAFGLSWDDTSGRNNGQFAPFRWSGR